MVRSSPASWYSASVTEGHFGALAYSRKIDHEFHSRPHRGAVMILPGDEEIPVTRALNVRLEEAAVIAKCDRQGATISAIEPLPGGGTRVVLANMEDATAMVKAFGRNIIKGAVARTNFIARRHG